MSFHAMPVASRHPLPALQHQRAPAWPLACRTDLQLERLLVDEHGALWQHREAVGAALLSALERLLQAEGGHARGVCVCVFRVCACRAQGMSVRVRRARAHAQRARCKMAVPSASM